MHVTVARPVTSTLSGTITDGTSGGILPNIHVQIADSANAGKSTQTDGTGRYSIASVAAGTMTVVASATSYQATQKTVTVAGDTRLDFVLPRVPPPRLAFSTTASQGWTSIEVSVGGRIVGTLRRFYEPGAAASCDAVVDARVVATVSAGTTLWSARSDRGATWSGSVSLTDGACYEVQLTCTNRDCAGAPTPTPTPPPPVPTPTPSNGLYVWGGPNYTQFLGFFTCVFCTEFASDSVNNLFGSYGSQFSSTSIRNQFSQYGSPFSTYSACNEFAFNPPKVFNSNRSVYYGELTVNQFRFDAIKNASIVNWLIGDVCRH